MDNNKIVGVVLIVIGALLLLNWLNIPYLGLILGILVLVAGILMLMGKMSGAKWLAITCIILGALVVLASLDLLPNAFNALGSILVFIVAIILIVVGVMKLMNKA